ncbi:hybrid sensor histidine kinase/response regulator [Paludibacterium yongneupense]|uniref:hybrid sensor histidine kinase/response regulator n=1 Tax=Paludibacterium yongneupense TaxID=400061 RepID=UPI0003FB3AA9|nr:response regulator [Paludibacterium yongneupense]
MALDPKKFAARFVAEAREHIGRLERGLAALSAAPADPELINTVFRSAHTIKGASRMLKYGAISETSHKLEDALDALRSGSIIHTPELVRHLQRGVDAIAGLVEQVAEGREPTGIDTEWCAELEQAVGGSAARQAAAPCEAEPERPTLDIGASPLKSPDTVRVPMSKLDELIKLMGEVVSSHGRLRQRLDDSRALERSALSEGLSASGRARLHTFTQQLKDDVLAQERLMDELHGKALVMRMLPLSGIFEALPRRVRELGRSMGKEVECTVEGLDIELDRQLIDRLSDPLLHLLRNAVDHGIESVEQRERAGKPRHGRVHLSARQDGGCVVIDIRDDGAGIDIGALRDKAVRKELMSQEAAQALSDPEVVDLIFVPGFSTSAIITDVSGRGVGMDVVKRCVIDELQGAVAIDTRTGAGTTFSLRLPPSLAVMRVLLVSAGGKLFGFSAQQLAQLWQLPEERLLTVAGRRVVAVDNEFIPVVGLADLMCLPTRGTSSAVDVLLVVVRVRNEKLALRVDALVDEHDRVLKPLPAHLAHLDMVAGIVVTGRNELVSVLHAPALLERARHARADVRLHDDMASPSRPRILVVDDSLNTREIEKDVLEAHGYHVTLAEDGRDGLYKARNGDFDAILTDVEMPNMDGFTLTTLLREEERYRTVPIIIITSRQKEEDRRRGIQVGADAYIVKGDFDQGHLIEILQSILG